MIEAGRGLVNFVQVMAHAGFLRVHVESVIVVRLYFNRHTFYDSQAVAFKTYALHGIVTHKSHVMHAERTQDICSHTIISLIGLVPEMKIGIDCVETLFLKFVSTYFIHQSYTAPLLIEIYNHTAPFLLYHAHCLV